MKQRPLRASRSENELSSAFACWERFGFGFDGSDLGFEFGGFLWRISAIVGGFAIEGMERKLGRGESDGGGRFFDREVEFSLGGLIIWQRYFIEAGHDNGTAVLCKA